MTGWGGWFESGKATDGELNQMEPNDLKRQG